MGKISKEDLDLLVAEGKISKELAKKWVKDGTVAVSKRETARYLRSTRGLFVRPELVFAGLKGDEYSPAMEDFKTKFNELVKQYCFTEEQLKEKK